MNARWTAWLATLLLTTATSLALFSFAMLHANDRFAGMREMIQIGMLPVLPAASLVLVGYLLAIHRPTNPIGWMFLLAGIGLGLLGGAEEYGIYLADHPDANLPRGTLLLWLANWFFAFLFVPLTLGILLFPTGRPPSRRWRPVLWFGIAVLSTFMVSEALRPGLLAHDDPRVELENPFGLSRLDGLFAVTLPTSIASVPLLIVVVMTSLIFRYRSVSIQERQQLKWFIFSAAMILISIFIQIVEAVAASPASWDSSVGAAAFFLAVASLPAAIGVAILRHNLYDIDRLINRTLVYGGLTILLGVGFGGSVILFQIVLSPLTSGNDLAVAGSTLIVFALSRPLRDRLQSIVNRRFYRQRYDAQRAIDAFRVSARDAIDAGQITRELAIIVASTVQPSHVSVWLRARHEGGDE